MMATGQTSADAEVAEQFRAIRFRSIGGGASPADIGLEAVEEFQNKVGEVGYKMPLGFAKCVVGISVFVDSCGISVIASTCPCSYIIIH